MQSTQDQRPDRGIAQPMNVKNTSSPNLLWICLVVWVISFFLPAAETAGWTGRQTEFGWQVALEALAFFFVPIKGAWFGFDPHVWSVFANFFMLWAPFQIKRLKKTNGRTFAIAFAIAAAVPVGLLFIPESMDLASVRAFEVGFALWALSILGASAWFSWTVWSKGMALLPNIVLAATLFCGIFIWSPFLQGQRHRAEQLGEQDAKLAVLRQQQEERDAAALNAISQNGLTAFMEPMSETEERMLESYISAHKFTPAELTEAADHYQNPTIMKALAQNPDCPAGALEILQRHATEKEKEGYSGELTAEELYSRIAENPNVSPDLLREMLRSGNHWHNTYFIIAKSSNASSHLLLEMLRSGNPGQRAAALRSGKLPSKQKLDYLEKGCALTDDSEMIAVAEEADTPVEILECLSVKPGAAIGLAANPHTPTNVLEQMSQSPDWRIANEAKIALKWRKQESK